MCQHRKQYLGQHARNDSDSLSMRFALSARFGVIRLGGWNHGDVANRSDQHGVACALVDLARRFAALVLPRAMIERRYAKIHRQAIGFRKTRDGADFSRQLRAADQTEARHRLYAASHFRLLQEFSKRRFQGQNLRSQRQHLPRIRDDHGAQVAH